MRVSVRGEDVLLFDLENGRKAETSTFDAAPDHWQTFALTRRKVTENGSNPCLDRNFGGDPLDFQECALLVGASVTVVGELHRRGDGRFTLQPWSKEIGGVGPRVPPRAAYNGASQQANGNEMWRTSWERCGCVEGSEGMSNISKVLVSDKEMLLQGPAAQAGADDDPHTWAYSAASDVANWLWDSTTASLASPATGAALVQQPSAPSAQWAEVGNASKWNGFSL